MILNGISVTTIDELDAATASMSAESRAHLMRVFKNEQFVPDTGLQVKIYSFISPNKIDNVYEPPLEIDFVTGLRIKLHRKVTLLKGECLSEEYYETFDGVTYSNLIVKETHVFTRDHLGFAVKRNTTAEWFMNNGQAHQTKKSLLKFYDLQQRMEEGKIRRRNLVDVLQATCIGLISIATTGFPSPTAAVVNMGKLFLKNYKLELDNFIESSSKDILACLTDAGNSRFVSPAEYAWIDSLTPYGFSIRAYLINELTI